MTNYQKMVDDASGILRSRKTWASINAEYIARMKLQNQFKTGLDVAKYTAKIMRKDMEEYDQVKMGIIELAHFTQSIYE